MDGPLHPTCTTRVQQLHKLDRTKELGGWRQNADEAPTRQVRPGKVRGQHSSTAVQS